MMCGSGRFGTSCHSLAIIADYLKKATGGFAENIANTPEIQRRRPSGSDGIPVAHSMAFPKRGDVIQVAGQAEIGAWCMGNANTVGV